MFHFDFSIIILGLVSVVCFFSWVVGHARGVSSGVEGTLSYLTEENFLQREILDDDTIIHYEPNLVYYDKCQNCDCGMVFNPAVTKGHKSNGDKD